MKSCILGFEMVQESGSCGCVFALLAKHPSLSHNIKIGNAYKKWIKRKGKEITIIFYEEAHPQQTCKEQETL